MNYSNFDIRCANDRGGGLILSGDTQQRLREIAEAERERRREYRREYNRQWQRQKRLRDQHERRKNRGGLS